MLQLPSCCRLCHSPRCQLTPLAHPAPVLRRLCLLSAGASSLCWRLLPVLPPPVVHRRIHLRLLPCLHLSVRLVVAFPNASASSSCRASSRHHSLRHSLRLNFSSRPSRLIGCHIAQHLNPHLVATPPGALASASCYPLACYSIQHLLQFTSALRRTPLGWLVVVYPSASASHAAPLLFGWLLHIPAPQPLPLIAHHCFCCRRGAHSSPFWGLLRCCQLSTRPS